MIQQQPNPPPFLNLNSTFSIKYPEYYTPINTNDLPSQRSYRLIQFIVILEAQLARKNNQPSSLTPFPPDLQPQSRRDQPHPLELIVASYIDALVSGREDVDHPIDGPGDHHYQLEIS